MVAGGELRMQGWESREDSVEENERDGGSRIRWLVQGEWAHVRENFLSPHTKLREGGPIGRKGPALWTIFHVVCRTRVSFAGRVPAETGIVAFCPSFLALRVVEEQLCGMDGGAVGRPVAR